MPSELCHKTPRNKKIIIIKLLHRYDFFLFKKKTERKIRKIKITAMARNENL